MGRPRKERRNREVLLGIKLHVKKLHLRDFDKGDAFLERLHDRSEDTVFYTERPNGATIVLVPNPFTQYGRWLIGRLLEEFGWRREPLGNGFLGPYGKIMTNWRAQDVQRTLQDFRI